MSAEEDATAARTDDPRRIVRCNTCGRVVECTATDLLRYTREGWPKCCGHVVTCFTETVRPGEKRGTPPKP